MFVFVFKCENFLFNLIFNIVLLMLILIKFSGEKFFGMVWGLVIVFVFFVGYFVYDFI